MSLTVPHLRAARGRGARRAPQLAGFRAVCEQRAGRSLADPAALHAFSVDEPVLFWRALLDWTGLPWSGSAETVLDGAHVETARFFPDVRLSFAEALLRTLPDADDEHPAITSVHADRPSEHLTRGQLRAAVQQVATALAGLDIGPGDRVVAIAPNNAAMLTAVLGATALGATVSTSTPDMGAGTLLDRVTQTEPVLLVLDRSGMADGTVGDVVAGLPGLRAVLLLDGAPLPQLPVPTRRLADLVIESSDRHSVTWPRLPFDHPLFVMFSSGTTGPPKAIVHGAGGTLLEQVKEHRLHGDLRADDTLYFHTTTAWMMWNWQLAGLAVGAHIVLYDGPISGPETLWELVAEHRVTVFGTSPPYLRLCQDAGYHPATAVDVSRLRSILSTGAVLHEEQFRWVTAAVGDLPVQSISGGTDILGCFLLGHPELPVRPGRLQSRSLGLDVAAVDADGREVVGQPGELVCRRPFPSRPVGFLQDPGGARFHRAYFAQHAGVWTHGDLVDIDPDGSARVHGRSDGVLNVNGIRIGPAEVYSALRAVPEVSEAMAVEQRDPRRPGSSRMVLLVVLTAGARWDRRLETEIRRTVRRRASAAHVPSVVAAVDQLPLTHNGKRSERAARDAVNGDQVANLSALRNPESLELVRAAVLVADRPPAGDHPAACETYGDPLVRIWSETLGLRAPADPTDDFFDLGGTSRQVLGLLHRVRTELAADVAITDFSARPTLDGLAACVTAASATGPAATHRVPAATHPATLGELRVWMREDAEANRCRGGGALSVAAAAIFRLSQFGARATGPAAAAVRLLSGPLVLGSRLLLGCEMPPSLACGRRLVLAHGGRGVIVVAGAVLGDDVLLAPFSAVGAAYPAPGAPTIGDAVYVGAHASILGRVTIGDGAFIGTRALVLRDVAPGGLAVGTPATILDADAGRVDGHAGT